MGGELIILGTGGSAYDVLDIVDAINRCAAAPVWRVAGFLDDGRAAYVGAGALVRQSQRIGDGVLVGMGAVVVRDVREGTVVVGNPAKPLRAANARADVGTSGFLQVAESCAP